MQSVGPRESDRRRRLGAYYTPDPVAAALVSWALDAGPGRLLDPSFGGCSFLRAGVDALRAAGVARAGAYVFGCDVDPRTKKYASDLRRLGVPARNLVLANFFSTRPQDYCSQQFAAIVGNPPYVRHHLFQGRARAQACVAAEKAGLRLSRRASAWAYFVAHSTTFLKTGGKLSFLLPGSALSADYSSDLLEFVANRFKHVRLTRLRERVFVDVQEETVVLLAAGYGRGPSRIEFTSARSIDEAVAQCTRESNRELLPGADISKWKQTLLTPAAEALWNRLAGDARLCPLGSLATIRLGVVTGANQIFVQRAAAAKRFRGPGVRLVPIVARGKYLRTPRWTPRDQRYVESHGWRSRMLLIRPEARLSRALAKVIRDAEHAGIARRTKCSERDPWYAIRDFWLPDAFLSYMNHHSPRLVLNEARATSTNSIHRVTWKHTRVPAAAVIVGSWTTVFALGAELHGRHYGGGVLKLEPGEAARIPIPVIPGAGRWCARIERVARAGRLDEARMLADRVVLCDGMGWQDSQVALLERALSEIRSHRGVLVGHSSLPSRESTIRCND